MAWKIDGKIKVQLFTGKGHKIKIINRVSEPVYNLIIEFFQDEIYKLTEAIDTAYYIDDGPATDFVFKTTKFCWTYSHINGSKKDKIVIWAEKLLGELKR
ncbi:MAG: hypothetical protein R3B93_28435 [Bacteroidia bacterium]